MATLSTFKRLARLGGWLALSTGAMVAAACGAALSSACGTSAIRSTRDAGVDSATDTPQVPITLDGGIRPDASCGEAAPPVDADETDLWNVICE